MTMTFELKRLIIRRASLVLFACLASLCVACCFGKGTAYAALQYGSVPNCYVKVMPAYNTSLALDVYEAGTGNFANVSLSHRLDGHPNQVFYVQYRKTFRGIRFYSFRAVHSGRYLDVCGGSSRSGTNLHQYQWNGTASQLFCFIKNDNGNVIIKSMIGDLVVDMNGGLLRSGTNVQLWGFNNSKAQQWRLQRWSYQDRPRVLARPGTVGNSFKLVAYTMNATSSTCKTLNSKVTYSWSYLGGNYYYKARRWSGSGSSGLRVFAYNRTWGWVNGTVNLWVSGSSGYSLRAYGL